MGCLYPIPLTLIGGIKNMNMNIKKIIKEEIDDFNWVSDIETPLSWLTDNFGDLKPIVNGDKTFYVNDKNNPLFYFNQGEKNGYCYFSYDKIWKVLVTRFGININEVREVREVLTTWLGEVYGITGRTPYVSHHL